MHAPASLADFQATVSVFGTEVPLSLYWQAVDLWSAGHSTESIVVHVVATRTVGDIQEFRKTVSNIVYNQELIKGSTRASNIQKETRDMRRNSRIHFVGELDNLDVAQMVAQRKEKERLGLKQFLAKLG